MNRLSYNPFSLENNTFLVTGASSGIGRSIAVECSRLGASVYITARNEERLCKTLSQMEGEGHQMILSDLSEEGDIDLLVNKLPPLDGVVHCAGIQERMLCKMLKSSDIENIMAINFNAPILLQRTLLRKKKISKGASIVFIASRAAFAPTVGNALYAASKGAILSYAKVLGLELASRQIRVNSICPAMVWTDLTRKDETKTGADYNEVQKSYPLQRYGKPEDIAYLAVYLLSDTSVWMTGSAIDITGGGELTLV